MSAVSIREQELSSPFFTAAHAHLALTGATGWGFDMRWLGAVSLGSTLTVDGNTLLSGTLAVVGTAEMRSGLTVYTAAGSEATLKLKYNAAGGFVGLGASNSATPDLIMTNNAAAQLMRVLTGGSVVVGTGTSVPTYAGLTVQSGSTDAIALTQAGNVRILTNGAGLYIANSGGTSKAMAVLTGSNVATFGTDVAATLQGTTTKVTGTTSAEIQYSGTTRYKVDTTGHSWFGAATAAQQTVTGARGGNVALANLLTALVNYGLIVDSTTA